MNSRDQVSGLFWLGISIFVCLESRRVGIGAFQSPEPGFLPFCGGVILGIFAIILLIINGLKKQKEKEITNLWKGVEWGKVIMVFCALFIYTALLAKVGYLLMTFGLMTILFGILEKRRLWIRGIAALFTALATYFVFYTWLKIQLPKGILDF
jgi:putative tricarboxylic transport membrane protein